MKKLSLILALVMILNVFSCVSVSAADVNDFARATASTNRTVHLTGISNATSGIYVKWNAISGATGYRVYKRGAGETSWTYLTTVQNTYYTDAKVVSGNYYRYTVRATFNNGYGGYESGLYIKRLVNPYSIKATNGTAGVSVTWGKVNGASSYYVYRRAAGQSSWTRIASVTATSFVDKNVANGTYYKYTVRAVSGSTLSYFYDGSLVKYVAAPKVSRLVAGTNNVTVYWNAISGATGYRVYRRSAGQTSWTYLATVTTTTYVDTKVVKNNYYRYTVRAQSGNYMSGFFADGPFVKFTGIAGSTGSGNNPGGGSSENGGNTTPAIKNGEETFNFYKKACLDVKFNDAAGFTRKEWEEVKSINLGNDALNDLISTFMTSEAEAEEEVNPKGSYEAEYCMPTCGATYDRVKSATCEVSGDYYIIKIVMKTEVNPRKNSNGIALMGTNILYLEDVEDTIANDPAVNLFVKGINNGEITYRDYTITAKMTKDGKFVDLRHYVEGYIAADVKLIVGNVSGNGTLAFNSHWYDFKY